MIIYFEAVHVARPEIILIRLVNLLMNVNAISIPSVVTDNSNRKSPQIIFKKMDDEIIDFKIP
jgi:hypothetical protein